MRASAHPRPGCAAVVAKFRGRGGIGKGLGREAVSVVGRRFPPRAPLLPPSAAFAGPRTVVSADHASTPVVHDGGAAAAAVPPSFPFPAWALWLLLDDSITGTGAATPRLPALSHHLLGLGQHSTVQSVLDALLRGGEGGTAACNERFWCRADDALLAA
eukprot:358180-Chlamydomonas_euryale.AAC.5